VYPFSNPIRGITSIAYSFECGDSSRCPSRVPLKGPIGVKNLFPFGAF
jgi:hypothetical protein